MDAASTPARLPENALSLSSASVHAPQVAAANLAQSCADLRREQVAFDACVRVGAEPAGLLRSRTHGQPALLHVYGDAYAARLVDALRDNYEVLAKAMGDDAFDALARAYIAAHASRTASIRWFGDRLAEFIRARCAAGDAAAPHPAYVDLAAMDWALRAAFDSADAPRLDRQTLATIPSDLWPALRLSAHPSVRIVALSWAVESAWKALRDHDWESNAPEPETPAPQPLEHDLLVWRIGLETRWRSLAALESVLLRSATAGDDFASLCARAATLGLEQEDADDDPALRVAHLLARWVGDGLFTAVAS
jgi:Putative DNA-binding domain